ncbi:MAG: NUDIX hydrolase [Synechococcaceae cyanobacterium SM2_3_1]|nr:NUDIX hydrolase [Synechococcaceae cyanobacterium SM2_3_1]
MGIPEKTHPAVVLHERFRYQGKKYTFVCQRMRFPRDKEGEREYLIHPGGAMVIPVTAEGSFLCLRQYRFAVGTYIYEFPAGTLEFGEAPADTIQRELEEETGYRAHRWDSLGEFFLAPGYSDEVMYCFLARDLEKLPDPPPQDDDEDITVVEYTPAELAQLIMTTGELDAKSIACFYRAQMFLANEQVADMEALPEI